MASTDCGFGTFVGLAQVAPSVAWAKLRALVEGAALVRGQKERTSPGQIYPSVDPQSGRNRRTGAWPASTPSRLHLSGSRYSTVC